MDIKEFAKLLALDAEEALRIMADELKQAKQELILNTVKPDYCIEEVTLSDNRLPSWANWLYQDANGDVKCSEYMPHQDLDFARWSTTTGMVYLVKDHAIYELFKHQRKGAPWTDRIFKVRH